MEIKIEFETIEELKSKMAVIGQLCAATDAPAMVVVAKQKKAPKAAPEAVEETHEAIEEIVVERAPAKLTTDDVMEKARAYLARATKASNGDAEKGRAKVRNILGKFGVNSVREVKPEDFEAVIKAFN